MKFGMQARQRASNSIRDTLDQARDTANAALNPYPQDGDIYRRMQGALVAGPSIATESTLSKSDKLTRSGLTS